MALTHFTCCACVLPSSCESILICEHTWCSDRQGVVAMREGQQRVGWGARGFDQHVCLVPSLLRVAKWFEVAAVGG